MYPIVIPKCLVVLFSTLRIINALPVKPIQMDNPVEIRFRLSGEQYTSLVEAGTERIRAGGKLLSAHSLAKNILLEAISK